MKVLVTGGTGFIGLKLIDRLLDQGHNVFVLVRSTSNTSLLPQEVTTLEGDLFDSDSIKRVILDSQAEVVVHLAAYFDFYPKDKELLYKTNVDGTRNMMNACVGSSVNRFIYCSTTEVIGPVDNPPGDEESELRPQWEYSKSKVLAEEAIREISEETGLSHIILRPTGVVGEGELYVGFDIIEALYTGSVPVIPTKGEGLINMFMHVDDVVSGISLALNSESALNQTIILCPDDAISWKELFGSICEYIGKKPPRRGVPVSLAKAGMAILSRFKGRGRKTFLWHTQSIEAVAQHRWYTNEKAKRLLGWSPQYTMVEGFERSYDWYIENGYLERKE
jgi:nucleoside-diphosphate-sugar epimerase